MAPRIVSDVRAVLYLRMSSGKQEQSIPAQRTELLAYAKKHGYIIVREYIDEAVSGDDTERRAGFLRMREDAAGGEFSVVLCWDQDRFGRFDNIEGGHWIYPFRSAGVRLETIAQGKIDWNDFAGRLTYFVAQEAKHSYLIDLARNTSRGLLAAARAGRSTGSAPPFGFDRSFVPVEPQASVVRETFRRYLDGASLRAIADWLTSQATPAPKGGVWRVGTVRRILTNRRYTGAYVSGENQRGRYYSWAGGEVVARCKCDGKRQAESIVHENHHPAIVTEPDFAAVQAKLTDRKHRTTPVRGGGGFVLSGLLRCGCCGSAMTGTTQSGVYRYYVCQGYSTGGKAKCQRNAVAQASLADCLCRVIRERYLDDASLDAIGDKIRRKLTAERTGGGDAKRLQKRLATLDAKISSGAERVLSVPAGAVAAVAAKVAELEAERDRVRAELAEAIAAGKRQDNVEATVAAAIEGLRDIRQALVDAEPDALRELLASLVDRVELHFSHKPRGKRQTACEFEHGDIYLRPLKSSSLFRLPPAAVDESSPAWGFRPLTTVVLQMRTVPSRSPLATKICFYLFDTLEASRRIDAVKSQGDRSFRQGDSILRLKPKSI